MPTAPTARGFTLVEVLIAMVLLSLIAVALAAAVRAIGQTQERVDTRIERWDEERVAAEFVQSVLQRLIDRKRSQLQEGQSQFYFSGQPTQVMWMGVMPANYGVGGRALFRLGLEPVGRDGGTALVIRWQAWEGELEFPDWRGAQARVLVDNIHSLAFRYADSEQPSAVAPVWVPVDRLPVRVELSLATQTSQWPTLVVPLYRTGVQSGSPDGFSFGGRQ